MPCMTGWEFLEQAKKENYTFFRESVIVVLTSSGHYKDLQLATGFDIPIEYKTKPLTKEALEEILSKFW